ncbi:PREDICTED: F-box protein At5g07610-like [Fragaria vesca subsp. vesca]|uniref:F-box protein At5g07610-like n=1 Tax=Fragaria vesca subsp. vesca TaxID=101020 RepID=UPI0002C2F427|nr:PREDICTED: F-box protein At5g07610-like [Fragaria vesca subsp. vesca]XP_011464707.1 PREDICTED: F-box protein At5g07610-like [Fragaria vesca subsp. vesca]
MLYSSETQKWKIQGSARSSWPADLDYKHGVYCNGGIHWIRDRDDQLSRYDIDKDFPRLVSNPSGHGLMHERKFRYFGESRGHLQLIDIYKSCVTEFDVMEMGKDDSGWFVKYHVDLNPIGTVFPEVVCDHLHLAIYDCYSCCVLFLAREETEENSSILLHIPMGIISYNVSDKTVKKLNDLIPKGSETMGSLQPGWGDACPHIATLARV